MKSDTGMEILPARITEDDSPFLSMADFFSLISMMLIYISIAVAAASPLPEDAIPVLLGRVADPKQAIAANPTYAYVTIESYQDGIGVHVTTRGKTTSQFLALPLETTDFGPAASWIEGQLLSAELPDRVIMRIRATEPRAEAHRIFNALVASTQLTFAVSIVMVE